MGDFNLAIEKYLEEQNSQGDLVGWRLFPKETYRRTTCQLRKRAIDAILIADFHSLIEPKTHAAKSFTPFPLKPEPFVGPFNRVVTTSTTHRISTENMSGLLGEERLIHSSDEELTVINKSGMTLKGTRQSHSS
jgi:hypothetical protein